MRKHTLRIQLSLDDFGLILVLFAIDILLLWVHMNYTIYFLNQDSLDFAHWAAFILALWHLVAVGKFYSDVRTHLRSVSEMNIRLQQI